MRAPHYKVLISEGHDYLVGVEDCFPATVSLLRTVERLGEWGLGWCWLREKKKKGESLVSPAVKLLSTEVTGCFY